MMKDSFETTDGLYESLPGKMTGNLASTILDNIDAFICIIDITHLKFLWTNQYSTRRLGYSAEEFRQMTSGEIMALIQPCFQSRLTESIRRWHDNRLLENTITLQVKTKKDSWIRVLAHSSPYDADATGNLKHLLVYASEIDIALINGLVNEQTEDEPAHPQSDKVKTLSVRERKILRFIINCNTDKEISEKLNISIHTAKTHRKRIIHKLGVKNSRSLIKYAVEISLVEPSRS